MADEVEEIRLPRAQLQNLVAAILASSLPTSGPDNAWANYLTMIKKVRDEKLDPDF